jgi:SEC-C motif-containing protein
MTTTDLCPCESKKPYDECCGPLHRGDRQAETAEELMRSRYSAFVKQEIDYIIDTAHSDSRKDLVRDEIAKWARESTWNGFEVIDTEGGGPDDEQGLVEFIAFYDDAEGDEVEHHEKSIFAREDGQWRFVDGLPGRQEPYRREEPKVGRNDPCPCGSGKKYKKCCARAA